MGVRPGENSCEVVSGHDATVVRRQGGLTAPGAQDLPDGSTRLVAVMPAEGIVMWARALGFDSGS